MSRSIFHTIKVHRLEEAYARGEKKMKVLLINGSPHEKGCTYPALDQMNKYFLHGQMLVPGSRYWNMVHGNTPEEVLRDEEGLQVMRVLGRNMAWLLKLKAAGEAAGIKMPKQEERRIATIFIH